MRIACLLFVALLTGCGDLVFPAQADGGTSDDQTDDAGLDAPVDVPPPVDAFHHDDADTLHLLSFGASPAQVATGQSVTFSVLVSDDLGQSDIVTAKLVDDTGATYAYFPQAGSFMRTVALTWEQMQGGGTMLAPVTSRNFSALIVDRQGWTATASVTLTFEGVDGGALDAGAAYAGGADAAVDAPHDAPADVPSG